MKYGRSGPKKTHFLLHQDNAPAHRAESTIIDLDLFGFDRVDHAPLSPDLAPIDFKAFPTVKAELRGRKFENTEELVYANRTIVNKLDDRWYSNVFNEWVKRHTLCEMQRLVL